MQVCHTGIYNQRKYVIVSVSREKYLHGGGEKVTSIQYYSIKNNRKQYSTFHLFSRPSLMSGIGSILNIRGNYYKFKTYKNSDLADKDAIENDWGVVGNDIIDAMREYVK